MTIQTHNGDGDNVLGDKITNNHHGMKTEFFTTFIEDFMRDISYRDLKSALDKIITIEKLDSLDKNIVDIISALKIKIKLIQNDTSIDKSILKNLLRNNSITTFIRGVITSILIDLEARNDPVIAKEIFNLSKEDSSYLNEVYYELLANNIEIEEIFISKKHDLLEQELTGLLHGAIRNNNIVTANSISFFLHTNYPSKNSEFYCYHLDILLFFNQVKERHFYSFNKNEKNKLESFITTLIEHSVKNNDKYIVPLVNLIILTCFSDNRLINIAKSNINKIQKLNTDIANEIEEISELKSKFVFSDSICDKEILAQLFIGLEQETIDLSELHGWRVSGGKIKTHDEYINSYYELMISTWLCNNEDKKLFSEFEMEIDKFFSLNPTKFKSIPSFLIEKITQRFISLNLPLYAVKFIEPFLPEEPWVSSPLFENFLQALYDSEQYDTFFKKIIFIPHDEKNYLILSYEAHIYEKLHNYDNAIIKINESISKEPLNPYSWNLLLRVLKKNNQLEILKDTISNIPEKLFESYHQSTLPLIANIAANIDAIFANKIMIDWFIKDPNKLAKTITDIHHHSIEQQNKSVNVSYITKLCIKGVVYSDGFDEHRRIIVKDVETSHPILLNNKSPIGKVLSTLSVGESSIDPRGQSITLIEEIDPYVIVYQEALKIRNEINDGSDVFKMFTMPSNKNELIPYMEKILKQYPSNNFEGQPFLKNPDLPLIMKGALTNIDSPIKAAHFLITSKISNKYIQLHNSGVESPSKMIIDIYTAVYLALIGFISILKNLNIDIILSNNTKEIMTKWTNDILREDYLSLDINEHGLQRITSKEIKKHSYHFISELKLLIKISKTEPLSLSNTPNYLIELRDFIDTTLFSTIQLSNANNIPWLSIDYLMCILSEQSDQPIVNMSFLINKMMNSASYFDRKLSIKMNLLHGINVPIFYQDILELCHSNDDIDLLLVTKFLKKYNNSNWSDAEYQSYLIQLIKVSTSNIFIKHGYNAEKKYMTYISNVFNTVSSKIISISSESTSEEKFALFIHNIIYPNIHPVLFTNFIFKLATNFASGHFLNINIINEHLDFIYRMKC